MRVTVDIESDTLYFRLSEDPIAESEEVSPGIIVDYDGSGKVIGLEILEIKRRVPMADLSHVMVELPTGI